MEKLKKLAIYLIIFLLATVCAASFVYAYGVNEVIAFYHNGEKIGYINDISVVSDALNYITLKVYEESGGIYEYEAELDYSLESVFGDVTYLTEDDCIKLFCDNAEIEYTTGFAVKIDGEEIAFLESLEDIEAVIDTIYTEADALFSPLGISFYISGLETEEDVRFECDVNTPDELYYMLSDFGTPSWLEQYSPLTVNAEEDGGIVSHSVDYNPENAKKYSVPENTSELEKASLCFYYTLTIKVEETIEKTKHITYDQNRNDSYYIVNKKGSDGLAENTYSMTFAGDSLTEKTLINHEVTKQSTDEYITMGARKTTEKGVSTGYIMWPYFSDMPYITSFFGTKRIYEINGHCGMDSYLPEGTKIYAADGGVVSISREYGSYGLMIMIDHAGGMQTVYGHLSELLVEEGEEVAAGQLIALSGNTGQSTMSHLHFEVRIDGEYKDPLDYLPEVPYRTNPGLQRNK